jgi:hypothetical protein
MSLMFGGLCVAIGFAAGVAVSIAFVFYLLISAKHQ